MKYKVAMSNIVISNFRIGTIAPFFGYTINSTHTCTSADINPQQYGCYAVGQIGRANATGTTLSTDQWIVYNSNGINVKTDKADINPASVGNTPSITDTVTWLDSSAGGNAGKQCGKPYDANCVGGDGHCNPDAPWVCNGNVAAINASRDPSFAKTTKPWYALGVLGDQWTTDDSGCSMYKSSCTSSTIYGGDCFCDEERCPLYHRNCGGQVVGDFKINGIVGDVESTDTHAPHNYTAIISQNGINTSASCGSKGLNDICIGGMFVSDITDDATFDCFSFYENASNSKRVVLTLPDSISQKQLDNTPNAVDPAKPYNPPATQRLTLAETVNDLYSTTGSGYSAGFGNVLYTPPVDVNSYTSWIQGFSGTKILLDTASGGAGPEIPTSFISAITTIQCLTGAARLMAINAFNYFGSWDRRNFKMTDPTLNILSTELTDAIGEYSKLRDGLFTTMFQTQNRSDFYQSLKKVSDDLFFGQSSGSLFVDPVVCTGGVKNATICLNITVPTDIALSFLSEDRTDLNHTNLQNALNAFFGEGTIDGTDYPQSEYAYSGITHKTATYTNTNGVESIVISGSSATIADKNSIDVSNATSFSFYIVSTLQVAVTNPSKMLLAYAFHWNPLIAAVYCTNPDAIQAGKTPIVCFNKVIQEEPQKALDIIQTSCKSDDESISNRFYANGYDYIVGPKSSECLCYHSRLGPVTTDGNAASMCFSNECEIDGKSIRSMFGLTDDICKNECPTVTGWFGDELVDPGTLNPAELDDGRLSSLCNFKPVLKTDKFNTKSVFPVIALVLLIISITVVIVINKPTSTIIISVVFAIFVSGLIVGGLGWLSGAGLTECVPPYNAYSAPNPPNVTCQNSLGWTLPSFLCKAPVVGCECTPSGGCSDKCVCKSGTCIPLDGKKRDTTTIKIRHMTLIIYYTIIAILALNISAFMWYKQTKNTNAFLILLIPALYAIAMIIKESVGRSAQSYSGPCGA